MGYPQNVTGWIINGCIFQRPAWAHMRVRTTPPLCTLWIRLATTPNFAPVSGKSEMGRQWHLNAWHFGDGKYPSWPATTAVSVQIQGPKNDATTLAENDAECKNTLHTLQESHWRLHRDSKSQTLLRGWQVPAVHARPIGRGQVCSGWTLIGPKPFSHPWNIFKYDKIFEAHKKGCGGPLDPGCLHKKWGETGPWAANFKECNNSQIMGRYVKRLARLCKYTCLCNLR